MFNVKFSYEGAIFHARNTNRVPCIGEHIIIDGWFRKNELKNLDILNDIQNECLFEIVDVCTCCDKDCETYEIEVKPWEDEE